MATSMCLLLFRKDRQGDRSRTGLGFRLLGKPRAHTNPLTPRRLHSVCRVLSPSDSQRRPEQTTDKCRYPSLTATGGSGHRPSRMAALMASARASAAPWSATRSLYVAPTGRPFSSHGVTAIRHPRRPDRTATVIRATTTPRTPPANRPLPASRAEPGGAATTLYCSPVGLTQAWTCFTSAFYPRCS